MPNWKMATAFGRAQQNDASDEAERDDFGREVDDAFARHSEDKPAGPDDADIRNMAVGMLQNGSDIADVVKLLCGD